MAVMLPHDAVSARAAGVSHDQYASGVTAAVCTRDRTALLERAIRSLLDQRTPAAEVLVIDNAPSDDATRTLVRDRFPSVRYVREAVPGLDFARNRALREARGEIVAFLDDDAVADADWVASVERAFAAHAGALVCTGRVDALGVGTAGERLFEANGGFGTGDDAIRLPADAGRPLHGRQAPLVAWSISVGAGCNLAVRRERTLALGGFDEALDLGAVLPGGGDLDLIWRALEAGHEVIYEPTARVRHEHRSDARGAAWQIAEHNRALVALLTKSARHASGARRAEVLAFLAWRLVKPGVRLARRLAGRDPLPARVLLRLWWHCWRGLVAYPAAQQVAARRRGAVR